MPKTPEEQKQKPADDPVSPATPLPIPALPPQLSAVLRQLGIHVSGNLSGLLLIGWLLYQSGIIYLPTRDRAEALERKAETALTELAALRTRISELDAQMRSISEKLDRNFVSIDGRVAQLDRDKFSVRDMSRVLRNLEQDNKLVVREYDWRQ